MSYSDHEWLGRIPSHWKLRPLQYCLMECKERNGPEPVGEMLSVSGYTGVSVKEYEHESQKRSPEDLEDYLVVWPGQLVVNTMWLNHRGLGVSPHMGHVSPAYSVYSVVHDLDERFVHYLMRSKRYVDRYKSLLYGIRPNSLQIKSHDWDAIPLLVPSLDEQRTIADFLDGKTGQVDKLIDRKKRLIELLEERRTALITRAVTTGLDPDVPMKDSGVEWLGEIPEHWEVTRVGAVAEVWSGHPFSSEQFSRTDGIPLVRIRDIENKETEMLYAGDPVESARINTGDVIVGMDGQFNVAEWSGGPALLNQRLSCVRAREVDRRFLKHVLQVPLKFIEETKFSTTVKHLSIGEIRGARLPVPPREEQNRIAEELDKEIAHLDLVSRRIKNAVQLLHEYRQALISAAVTGKIDVRDYAA